MNSGLKQRLVGAIVLIAIAIIFVPSFLRERQVEPVSTKTLIPDRPQQETMTFESPSSPEGIEPAPPPESMFVPDDSSENSDLTEGAQQQPVADDLEDLQRQSAARIEAQSEQAGEVDQTDAEAEAGSADEPGSTEESGSTDPDSSGESEAAAGEGAWVVQVASFRSADSARNLRDRLQAEGYRAYMRSASTSVGEVSRVYIGPKVDRSEAEKAKAAIDASLKVESLVLRFEP